MNASATRVPLTVQYYPPSVSSVALFDNDPLFDCTNGVDSVGSRNATLVVYGANFGSGQATSVSVNGEQCAIVASRSSHSELYFTTHWCRGTIAITVAGKTAPLVEYSYELLVAQPVIGSVTPTNGPAAGGTVVTLTGSRFQFKGTVTFVDSDGVDIGECQYDGVDGMEYSPSLIRYV